MGNCSLKGAVCEKGPNFARVLTDTGGVMELEGPKLVHEVLNDFPGYAIFRQGQISSPLSDYDNLMNGQVYYLLRPGKEARTQDSRAAKDQLNMQWTNGGVVGPERKSSGGATELVANLTNRSGLEVLPSPGNGIWRVKLVMDTKQLEEILSEQVNVEALIEQMRMAASSSASAKPTKGSRGINRRPANSSVP